MIVVDSSGWLEHFLAGPGGTNFRAALENTDDLLVPSIIFFEVIRVLRRLANDDAIGAAIFLMTAPETADLTQEIALAAAEVSAVHGLGTGDAIILATARVYGAELWTQDADFKDIDGVRYFEKTPAA
ncbi:MAG TPA: type II toxin-antitoxin system VapC family toxin [Tepidisphaeraceae bacterium]|jgi:predicted nucleic acid-binding protein